MVSWGFNFQMCKKLTLEMELSDPDPANHLKYKVIEGSDTGKHACISMQRLKQK